MYTKFLLFLVYSLFAFSAEAQTTNPLSIKTSLGTLTLAKKGLADDSDWVARWNNKVIHTFYARFDPDFFEGKDKRPLVGEFGDEIVVGILPGEEGRWCPGGNPFLIVLKKDGSSKVMAVPNDCREVVSTRIDGNKLLIALFRARTVIYENGKYQPGKPAKK